MRSTSRMYITDLKQDENLEMLFLASKRTTEDKRSAKQLIAIQIWKKSVSLLLSPK